MSRSTADKRDVYYRLCKSEGYRARSAYKLLHLDEEYDLFRGTTTACDLCAAPGSWSQVLSRRLQPAADGSRPKIVSVDLQPMAPLANVTTLHGDITLPSTVRMMLDAMGGARAELVVCDGAPEVTGVHDLDAYLHSQLLLAAFTLSLPLLAPHGTLIFKIFTSPSDPAGSLLISQMRPFFQSPPPGAAALSEEEREAGQRGECTREGYDDRGRRGGVWVRKPRSSRAGSAEAFLVCRNFVPPVDVSSFNVDALVDTAAPLSLSSFRPATALAVDGAELSPAEAERKRKEWDAIKAFTIGNLNPLQYLE